MRKILPQINMCPQRKRRGRGKLLLKAAFIFVGIMIILIITLLGWPLALPLSSITLYKAFVGFIVEVLCNALLVRMALLSLNVAVLCTNWRPAHWLFFLLTTFMAETGLSAGPVSIMIGASFQLPSVLGHVSNQLTDIDFMPLKSLFAKRIEESYGVGGCDKSSCITTSDTELDRVLRVKGRDLFFMDKLLNKWAARDADEEYRRLTLSNLQEGYLLKWPAVKSRPNASYWEQKSVLGLKYTAQKSEWIQYYHPPNPPPSNPDNSSSCSTDSGKDITTLIWTSTKDVDIYMHSDSRTTRESSTLCASGCNLSEIAIQSHVGFSNNNHLQKGANFSCNMTFSLVRADAEWHWVDDLPRLLRVTKKALANDVLEFQWKQIEELELVLRNVVSFKGGRARMTRANNAPVANFSDAQQRICDATAQAISYRLSSNANKLDLMDNTTTTHIYYLVVRLQWLTFVSMLLIVLGCCLIVADLAVSLVPCLDLSILQLVALTLQNSNVGHLRDLSEALCFSKRAVPPQMLERHRLCLKEMAKTRVEVRLGQQRRLGNEVVVQHGRGLGYADL